VYEPSDTVRQTMMRILKRPIRCRKEIGSGIPNAIAVAGSVVEQRDTAKELYKVREKEMDGTKGPTLYATFRTRKFADLLASQCDHRKQKDSLKIVDGSLF
jgi:hypothetical protein